MSNNYGCKCNCESFREHVGYGPAIPASATPTRSVGHVTEVNEREARWTKDHAAYRRLRQDGLQPKHLAGSAELERRATDSIEITDGRLYGEKLPLVKEYKNALKESTAQKATT